MVGPPLSKRVGMKHVKGIIFDCDGVLFESQQANLAYYNAILKILGEPQVKVSDKAKSHLCHTAASPQVFAGLLGPERVNEAMDVAAVLDYRQFIPIMNPEPGLNKALRCLASRLPLAVATNRGFSMPQILAHFQLTDFFQAVVTSRDVARPKPHPDMLIEAANRLQLPPEELLFVGDSELDQAAAKSAGISFAVYRGDLDADLAIEHHQQLVEIFLTDSR